MKTNNLQAHSRRVEFTDEQFWVYPYGQSVEKDFLFRLSTFFYFVFQLEANEFVVRFRCIIMAPLPYSHRYMKRR